MRSELVFAAKRRLSDRYALCRIAATATRKFHRPNTRIEDTTDAVLRHIADAGVTSASLRGKDISQGDHRTS
jgi:hypothetical protein